VVFVDKILKINHEHYKFIFKFYFYLEISGLLMQNGVTPFMDDPKNLKSDKTFYLSIWTLLVRSEDLRHHRVDRTRGVFRVVPEVREG